MPGSRTAAGILGIAFMAGLLVWARASQSFAAIGPAAPLSRA
jgi:hypothetical protein